MGKEYFALQKTFREHVPDRILIVDPEQEVCELLARRLTREGYACSQAGSEEEALVELCRGDFFLMISDIHNPSMDSLWLIREMKTRCPRARVIMTTATGKIDRVAEGLRLGADDFISKPIHLDLLSSLVQEAASKKEMDKVLEGYYRHLEEAVEERTAKLREAHRMLKKAHLDSVRILIEAIDAKDPYTRGHSSRVRRWTVRIGDRLGFSGRKRESLEFGALLHDIGMIGIRDGVLHKKEPLTPKEFAQIRGHCLIGVKIVEGVSFFDEEISVIRSHHERFDGAGYPDGLSGERIPLAARIVSVPDAYDAMTSLRAYRGALSSGEAAAELQRGEGKQFDPEILKIFLEEVRLEDCPRE